MPIPFTCPHCGEETLADERYAGHEGPCVNCGWTVTVPSDAPRVSLRDEPSGEPTRARDRTRTILLAVATLALVATVVGLATLLFGPALQAGKIITQRRRCAANLQQLALALDAYERSYGSYPPAFTIGPDGKPWHSWRVLVLPYLGTTESQLYQRYDMAQPWSSAHNMQLLTSMPDVFVSPADDAAKALYETSYVAVVGPGMVFTGSSPTSSAQIGDGRNGTILLVEIQGAAIAWTEPRDIDGRAIGFQIGTDLGGNHVGGVNVAMADGETHFLPDSMPPEEVHALLTRAGAEDVSLDGE